MQSAQDHVVGQRGVHVEAQRRVGLHALSVVVGLDDDHVLLLVVLQDPVAVFGAVD